MARFAAHLYQSRREYQRASETGLRSSAVNCVFEYFSGSDFLVQLLGPLISKIISLAISSSCSSLSDLEDQQTEMLS
jgi:hypothetical protein